MKARFEVTAHHVSKNGDTVHLSNVGTGANPIYFDRPNSSYRGGASHLELGPLTEPAAAKFPLGAVVDVTFEVVAESLEKFAVNALSMSSGR